LGDLKFPVGFCKAGADNSAAVLERDYIADSIWVNRGIGIGDILKGRATLFL
jgi:hypothetical protein